MAPRSILLGSVRRLVIALAVGALVLVGAGASLAFAFIPGAGGVISSCYTTKVGTGLRVIDAEAGATCGKNETLLTWNQTGTRGPKGDDGLQGPPGPSDAYSTHPPNTAIPVSYPDQKTVSVASLPLAAGSYVITGKVQIVTGGSGVECFLTVGSDTDHSRFIQNSNLQESAPSFLIAQTMPSGGTAEIDCLVIGPANALINDIRLVAIKVGSITSS